MGYLGTNPREEIEGYDFLEDLALDFSWLWNQNHQAYELWRTLDPCLWSLTRNPWTVLQSVSKEQLKNSLADPQFRKIVDGLAKAKKKFEQTPTWFQKKDLKPPISCIAYFSMEFMLAEALPIYSGGLGNVAGDQLKAASDLGVPVIGVGLLYQQGYFRQVIDKAGTQKAFFPFNDPDQMPITPVRKQNGELLRLEIALPGVSLWVRAWEVKVGRVKLYLLDSNDSANYPPHRGITSELYGGDSEMRIQQELLLGIGGWRLLEAMGYNPDVCHLNEGHAAFAVLERARSFMEKNKVSFAIALATTKAGNVFTTHTAVPAGFDRFSPFLMDHYLSHYAKDKLGIDPQELFALGRYDPKNTSEDFNMAYLAIRGSGSINGVSELHGRVSRHIFSTVFPRWPVPEVPVGFVTNGVHTPSWSSRLVGKLHAEFCGETCWLGDREHLESKINNIPDDRIWQLRNESRNFFVGYARKRLTMQLGARGSQPEHIEIAKKVFDPNALTIGFARRFATYKRPNMLLHNPERLLRILTNPKYPVQLVIAGKAHPADRPGQELIRQWIEFVRRAEVRPRAIFLSDYDTHMTERLVHGVDVWVNTPRRPWEACGTSGMKVLVNGGLNLSELDGWWVEAYNPKVGWALGDGKEHGDDPSWDAAEADALYDLLEKEVIPEFYNRNQAGIPTAWVARVRESMAKLTPRFSADRAVIDYTEKHYIPAANAYRKRAANQAALGKQIYEWQTALNQKWASIRFGDVNVKTNGSNHNFEVQIFLNGLDPQAVKVQLFADGSKNITCQDMQYGQALGGNMHLYRASVPSSRPAADYTPRVIPFHPDASVPLEAPYILWQH